ncbi:hypothetical protein LRR81_15330 [Metabacillus sp. GX 13764]|uniref:hypothetical protein n=1 Tax=Metabacillus kandeliae TaxID=2900151 RepID=UPI001E42F466|nr:hypothetical protein [Metabacillus kandeliae]MCD7035616.1 hypothetical protein [Metabacillus kandeliae]
MAGLRIAAVIAIGVATLAPFVEEDGLERGIFSGISSRNYVRIYVGAVPACVLDVLADVILGLIEVKNQIYNLQISRREW